LLKKLLNEYILVLLERRPNAMTEMVSQKNTGLEWFSCSYSFFYSDCKSL